MFKKIFVLIALILHGIFSISIAQDSKTDTVDHYRKLDEKYKRLKDSLGLHEFIPAVSSVMINYKQIELNAFTSLASTTRYMDDNGNLLDLNLRQTVFYSTLQLTYGLSKNARVNVGIDINSVFARQDQDPNSSPFAVFGSEVTGNSREAKAITSIAPRLRWRPFRKNYNFTIQSSIGFPMPLSTTSQSVLGPGQVYFLTQFLYNQPLSKRLFLFGQVSFQYAFERGNAPALFYVPAAAYLSYLAYKKIIFFALADYIPVFTNENSWIYNRYVFQAGGGVQYQLSGKVLINGYYADNVMGKNYPAQSNYNISLRLLID